SVRVREIFAENERLIERLKSELQDDLDEDSAQHLYEGLRFLYEGAFDDYGVMKLMSDHLISYYEETGDFEKLIFIYHLMGFESYEFKGRILGEEGCDEAIAYFKKVLSFTDRYAEISDERIRRCFFTAYNNLIAPVAQTATKLRDEVFSFYNAAYALWNEPEVQKLDGGKEDFLAALAQMDEDMLFMEEYFWELSEEQKEQYIEFVGKLRENKDDEYAKESGAFVRASAIHRLLTGEAGPNEIVEEEIAYILSLPMPNYSDEEDIHSLFNVLNYHNTSCFVFSILKHYDFSDEEKRRYTKQFIPKVTELHTHVPYDYCTSQINQVCVEWYEEIGSFLGDFETKKDCLMQLIVCRQPATYIHSLMVKEIASLITQALIKHRPELFIGVSACKDIADVNEHRAELLSLAENSGLLHDVGKCNIVEVINKQSRRLTDEEFSLIKGHPAMGSKLLGQDQDFDGYYDVMMGHHRSYDGRNGYPDDFDNTASPNRILIDIITISDCIDAATDVLGRNYATGKNFSVLAEELKEGAGTRYNPQVVEHIFEDKILWNNLDYITGEGRGQIYYQAYQDVLKVGHEQGYYYAKLK
ncbi:MAG: HD-GYP domain-containing protein, partial [Lachnospiraceae bacterium]